MCWAISGNCVKPAGRGTSEHEQLQQQQIELDAQKKEYQQAVMQMEQKKAQQTGAEAAAGPNGELKFQPEAPHAESEHAKPVEEQPKLAEQQQKSDVHPAAPGEADGHPAGQKEPEVPHSQGQDQQAHPGQP
ncbi:nucleobindin-1-like [Xenopus tropicalis]|uniref:Nucleobindin-1-like n=1 Tax=Xenopus tropicalis TaxID=8364 RepID=A0A8J1JZI1_XENTR|nr:nucleobindin-1-like [Xenopus tropicalis]